MGLANSFDQYPREWHNWYKSAEPESTHFPGECSEVRGGEGWVRGGEGGVGCCLHCAASTLMYYCVLHLFTLKSIIHLFLSLSVCRGVGELLQ